MVENFLELGSSFSVLVRCQVRFPARVDGIQSSGRELATAAPQLVGTGCLKSLDGLRGIVAVERRQRVNRWQVVELDYRILREALGQISRQYLSPGRVLC